MSNKIIYLDNNDTTRMLPEVLEEMLPFFKENFYNPSSLHFGGLQAESAIDKARQRIAGVLGIQAQEFLFTSGATESNNIVLFGAMNARPARKRLIISPIEHASVLQCAKRLEKEGFEVAFLKVDGFGYVIPESLEELIDESTGLVSVILANHEIGTIQNIKQLAEIAHSKGAWFHTDAAQAIGKMPVNLKELGVDFASLNAHKCHGPKGVGGLYFNRKARPKRLMEGAAQEFDLRPGTENVPAIVGFAKAVECVNSELLSNELFIRQLQTSLAEGLSSIPHTVLNGPPVSERLLGNLNITFRQIEGEAILMHLSNRGICVSSGSACSSKTLEPSPVLKAIGLLHEEAHGAIRFSLSKFNTAEEVETVITKTNDVVNLLRSITAFVPSEHSEAEGGKSFYRER